MWMNAPRTTEDVVNMLPVSTYLTASAAPAIQDTLVMVLPAQVRQLLFRKGLTDCKISIYISFNFLCFF